MNVKIRISIVCLLSAATCRPAVGMSRINGTTLDQDGNLLSGVRVTIDGFEGETITGQEGFYQIDCKPGEFQVRFEKPGYTWMAIRFDVPDEMLIPAPPVILRVLPPAPGVYVYWNGQFQKIEPNDALRHLRTQDPPDCIYAPEARTGAVVRHRQPTIALFGVETLPKRVSVSRLSAGSPGADPWGFSRLEERVRAKISRFNHEPNFAIVEFEEPLDEGNYAVHWGDLDGERAEGIAAIDFTVSTTVPEVVVLETTHGEVTLGFMGNQAPGHVENFKKLVRQGFYDGTKFHRVVPGYMIQGGCPNTKGGDEQIYGTGGPGYTIPAEFNDTKHVRGTLSMARQQDPDSAGCQFFICVGRAPDLDGRNTAFGFVVSGMDVVDAIVSVPTKLAASGEDSAPIDPIHLKRAYIKEAPADEIQPERPANASR